jgi:structural maintenance of chromosome 3 (chondroitin sulfate proteoglycan 6)
VEQVSSTFSLFNVVVDTDETAARILEILNAEKVACRITFMPLNKLNVRATELPSTAAVKPMIDIIKGKPMFKKAFLQVLITNWLYSNHLCF